MAKMQISVDVEKEIHEVAKCAANIVIAIKAKKSVVQIVAEEFKELEDAVMGFDQIAGEYEESKAAALKGALIPMCDMVDALLAKPAPAEAMKAEPEAAPVA